MSAVDPSCRDLAERLADLEEQAAFLEDLLEDPELTPTQRASIRTQLTRTRQTIAVVRHDLEECRARLSIRGIELTQGIQYFLFNDQGSGTAPNNSVPLIAQRALALRVYIDSKWGEGPLTPPIAITGNVRVERLRTDGSWQYVTVVTPTNGSIAPRLAASIDRGDPSHTLNFRLGATDCQGRLRLTVFVREQGPVVTDDSAQAATEAHGSSGVAQAAAGVELASASEQIFATFQPIPALRLRAVLVHYTGQGLDLAAPDGLDFAATLDLLLKTYPIGRLEFADCVEIDFDGDLSLPGTGCGTGWEELGDRLQEIAAGSDDPAITVALVPQGVPFPNVYGCGWCPGVAAAFDRDVNNMAQEVGHAFCRMHAPACSAPNADPAYPTYDNYPSGSIGEFGFDVSTSNVLDPAVYRDFMSYCALRWVSPYTYMALREAITERFGDLARRAFIEDRTRELLFLNFRLHRDGAVEVRPSFHLRKRANRAGERPPSDISCELLSPEGEVLVFHRCGLNEPFEDPDRAHVDFHETLPWAENAASIRFLRNRDVLHVHEIERTSPQLEGPSHQLRGDEPMNLQWSGSHPEKDLRYLVRYSNDDGERWSTVAANLREPACRINPTLLAGGEACRLEVVASSGVRTSVATADRFQLPLKRRKAHILAPDPGTEVPQGTQVLFRGGGFSSDFGLADMEDVIWRSDLDGMLGRGLELAAELGSTGLHTITVTVPDGVDGIVTARTSLRVTARE
jgi:hypothetical protein